MAISSTDTSVAYVGNGSTVTQYVIPFAFLDVAHIVVALDGVTLAVGEYTVTRDSDGGGGFLRTATAVASTVDVVILRETPRVQPSVFTVNGPLPAKTIETALDRTQLQIQEIEARLSARLLVLEAQPPEAMAPGAPTAVVGTFGNGSVSVAFTAPLANGGATITAYTVTASPGGATATGASSPLVVTGLTNGTAYTFTVTATNSVGTGAASSPSAAVTPATVAGAPTIGTATKTGSNTATVTFTAPASNGGATITGYTATSSPGGITGTFIGSGSGTITVSGLTANTAYTFTVTATNAAGTSAASAASNSITTDAATTYTRFWGSSTNDALGTTGDVNPVLSSEVDATKAKTVAITNAGSEYIYFAYPAVLGDLTAVYLNGNTTFNQRGGFIKTTRSITPSGGSATSYNVYRSEFPYFASTTTHQFI